MSVEDYDAIADIAAPGIVTADRVDEIEAETKHDIMARPRLWQRRQAKLGGAFT